MIPGDGDHLSGLRLKTVVEYRAHRRPHSGARRAACVSLGCKPVAEAVLEYRADPAPDVGSPEGSTPNPRSRVDGTFTLAVPANSDMARLYVMAPGYQRKRASLRCAGVNVRRRATLDDVPCYEALLQS